MNLTAGRRSRSPYGWIVIDDHEPRRVLLVVPVLDNFGPMANPFHVFEMAQVPFQLSQLRKFPAELPLLVFQSAFIHFQSIHQPG